MSRVLPNNIIDDNESSISKLFGRQRPIHEILGGGKDILLWRDKVVSSAYLIVVVAIWSLFELGEYNLVTFLCHSTITAMLVIFIWSNGAKVFQWTTPDIPMTIGLLEESTLYVDLCDKLNFFMSCLVYIACGNNIKHFCLTIFTLLILSTIGNYISTLNLLFIGFICMETLPYLYEKHGDEVDYFFYILNGKVSEIYKMIDTNVVSKIPRWPLEDKKYN